MQQKKKNKTRRRLRKKKTADTNSIQIKSYSNYSVSEKNQLFVFPYSYLFSLLILFTLGFLSRKLSTSEQKSNNIVANWGVSDGVVPCSLEEGNRLETQSSSYNKNVT
ncbi:MAG: hypothetical protein IAF38_20310 [Bacteroidia bacterium]|nr:hypothetical protein [Bacteroidia bacterium]